MELHFASNELGDWFDLHKAIDECGEIVPCTYWPDGYHPDTSAESRTHEFQMARKLCETCPVRMQCFDYSMKYEVRGTWGGVTEHDRNRMKRLAELKRRVA